MKPLYIPYTSNSRIKNDVDLERTMDTSLDNGMDKVVSDTIFNNKLSISNSCLINDDLERVMEMNLDNGTDQIVFDIIFNNNLKVISVNKNTEMKEIVQRAQELFDIKQDIFITTEKNDAVRLNKKAGGVVAQYGPLLKVVVRDAVGVNDDNQMDVSNGSRDRKKVELYNQHKFHVELGFSTAKEMYEMLIEGGDIQADIPRHLTILDDAEAGGDLFSKHPRRMIQMVLKRFLQTDDKIPNVSIYQGERGVEVNVEVKMDSHAITLLNTREIFGIKVKVTPHKFRNFTTVKVWDEEGVFAAFTEEELVEMMANKAVVKVKRETYYDKVAKEKKPGKSYKITLNKRERPKLLQFPLLSVQLETQLFVPKPFLCWHCGQLRHLDEKCPDKDKPKVCYKCSGQHATGEVCENEEKCVNCKGKHPNSYQGCPAFKQEQRILTLAAETKTSPWEVLKALKSKGEYIDYKRTMAQQISERKNEPRNSRTDEMEKTLREIKEMLTKQKSPIGGDGEGRDEDHMIETLREENAKLKTENERLATIEKENQKLTNDIRGIREELTQLKQDRERATNTEVSQLRQELKQLKESYEILLQATKTDSSILTKYNELVQANEQKDQTIANLHKGTVNNTAASNAVDLELLKTEYDLKLKQANKKIEEKDATIRDMILKVSRENPRDSSRDPRSQNQSKKSPPRSRSSQRSGVGTGVQRLY